jgi:O-antigen/teichoic acid export membrane protein
MIAGGLGMELAGVYTIAYFMGMVIEIPKRSLTNIIYPILNKAVIKKDALEIKSLYQKSSINQFLVGSFIFLIIWLNIDQIFMIIPNGDDFVAGKLVVLFIGLSKLFDMLMGVNKEIIELSKYYRFNLVLGVLLSVLVIVLNLIFIPLKSAVFGGINGVAFASLLALFISNLLAFVIVWRKEKVHPFTLNHGKIFVVIFVSSMLCYFIQVEHPILSISLTTACITLSYIFLTLVLNISEDFKSLFEAAKDKLINK